MMLWREFETGRRLQRSLCLVATALGCERKTIFIFVLKAAAIFFSFFFYKIFLDFILISLFQSISSSSNHIGQWLGEWKSKKFSQKYSEFFFLISKIDLKKIFSNFQPAETAFWNDSWGAGSKGAGRIQRRSSVHPHQFRQEQRSGEANIDFSRF